MDISKGKERFLKSHFIGWTNECQQHMLSRAQFADI